MKSHFAFYCLFCFGNNSSHYNMYYFISIYREFQGKTWRLNVFDLQTRNLKRRILQRKMLLSLKAEICNAKIRTKMFEKKYFEKQNWTHILPILHSYTPWNDQKTYLISEDIKLLHQGIWVKDKLYLKLSQTQMRILGTHNTYDDVLLDIN